MIWYSAADVARRLKIAKSTVTVLIADGSLEAVNIGRLKSVRKRWRISEKALAEFESRRKNEPEPATSAAPQTKRTIQRPKKDYFAASGGAK